MKKLRSNIFNIKIVLKVHSCHAFCLPKTYIGIRLAQCYFHAFHLFGPGSNSQLVSDVLIIFSSQVSLGSQAKVIVLVYALLRHSWFCFQEYTNM